MPSLMPSPPPPARDRDRGDGPETPRLGQGDQGTRERLVRRRRWLARLCLMWAALSLVSEVTPLGYWLDATVPNRDSRRWSWVSGGPGRCWAAWLPAVVR